MSVTFMLTCYNQEKFVGEAVRGALAQDYHPLEILIIDNDSTDNTLEILRQEIALYSGPHTVRLLTNDENIGLEVLAMGVEVARGTFIVGAHGDDISVPGRTAALVKIWQSTGASLVASNMQLIDGQSRVTGQLNPDGEPVRVSAETFAKGFSSYAHGACSAWHRDVFDKFPRLDQARLRGSHDHVLPFRAALLNGHYYVAEPLVKLRAHDSNFGLEGSARTRGKTARQETRDAYDLGARICMLDDLDTYISQSEPKPELMQLRTVLIDELSVLVRRWSTARNKLFAEGQRPTWVDRQELEQHEKGHSQIKTKKKKKNPLRKLLRKLASTLSF